VAIVDGAGRWLARGKGWCKAREGVIMAPRGPPADIAGEGSGTGEKDGAAEEEAAALREPAVGSTKPKVGLAAVGASLAIGGGLDWAGGNGGGDVRGGDEGRFANDGAGTNWLGEVARGDGGGPGGGGGDSGGIGTSSKEFSRDGLCQIKIQKGAE